jgi:hypothetical protein
MDVLGDVTVDLADEAQGEVELLVILPARAGYSLHQVQQRVPDRLGGADGDEQAVHAPPITAGTPKCDSRDRNDPSRAIAPPLRPAGFA